MFMLRIFSRLAWLSFLLFGVSSTAVIAVVVVATDGFGGAAMVQLPGQSNTTLADVSDTQAIPPGSLNETVQRREMFAEIPLPSEVSTDPPVVATNFTLTAILAVLFGLISTMLNNLLREKEDRLEAWMSIIYLDRVWRFFHFNGGPGIQRGCLGMPIIIMIFAVYGVIFAYLDEGQNIFQPEGVQLAIAIAISVTLISLSGDVAQRQVARFWRKTAVYGIYPANTIIAILTTIVSRLFGILPGIMFGTPGGVDVDMEGEPPFHQIVLISTTMLVMGLLGSFGWSIVALLHSVGDSTLNGATLEFVAPLVALAQTIGFALLVLAIETAFFEMAPLALTMGAQVFRWNILLWLVFFVPATFAFLHLLLNPQSEYLDAFEQTGVTLLISVVAFLAALTGALWVFLTYVEPPRQQVAARPPQVAQPPYYPPQQPYQQPPPPQSRPPTNQPPHYPPPPTRRDDN